MVELAELKARIGKVIKGKWTLDKLIGAGGMAAVYAATHEIGRREAIKILHPEVAEDPELVARFKREAHAVNRFNHPAALEIRDVDVTDDGEPFLVMELLEGESVARKLKREGTLEQQEVLRIADELLDALVAAHAEGVIHRDIKPSNLFLERDGRLRVLDFGIARLERGSGTLITEVGTQLGTVAYMPPEQLRGRDIDHRADIYALGATLFRLLSGEKTHHADGEDALAHKILLEPARPLAKMSSKVSDELCWVVDRALAQEPAERYPDAATMQKDIAALRRGDEPQFASARQHDEASKGETTVHKAGVREPVGKTEIMDDTGHSPTGEGVAPTAAGEGVAPTLAGEGVTPTLIDDGAAEDDTTTVKRTSTPPPDTTAEAQRGGTGVMWLGLAALAVVVGWLVLRDDDLPAEEPEAPIPVGADSASIPTLEDLPSADDEPRGEGGSIDGQPPAPGLPLPHPPALPSGLLPSAWPSAVPLPSGLPTAWPSALPALPTALPTSLPSTLPVPILPQPPPSNPPEPPDDKP